MDYVEFEFEWKETSNGNEVLIDEGQLRATVFKKSSEYGIIVDGQLVRGQFDTLDEAKTIAEQAINNPDSVSYVINDKYIWMQSKQGGWYIKTANNIYSVKQTKNGGWYACTSNGILPSQESPNWFKTADEAKNFVTQNYFN